MTVAYTGTKGEPILVPTGSTPSFAADIAEISGWLAAGRTFRKAATQAALNLLAGMSDNDLGVVDAIDGAHFKYDGALPGWRMHGVARFTDASARSSAITAPAQGMRSILETDPGYEWIYLAAYNASTNKAGANPAGWYPVDGSMVAQATRYNTSTTITNAATALGSLSAIGVAPGTPVAIDVELIANNGNSGGNRYITVQIFEDTTGLGTARVFTLPYVSGVGTNYAPFLAAVYTPAAGIHTWTVKVTADVNSAVAVTEARLTIRAATPRS